MRILATLDADMEVTPLGTRSRLAESLGGVPILRRTVERLVRCQKLAGIVVTFPTPQAPAVRALLAGTPATLRPRPVRKPPYRDLVAAARKWSLEAWRGGLGGSSSLDEYTDTELLGAVINDTHADGIAIVPPGAALIDPVLADAMFEHFVTTREEMRMTFAQAPPGLTPVIFQSVLMQQLAAGHVPPGWTLAYKPDSPSGDLAFKTCCFNLPQAIRYASGRLTADTNRSMRDMHAIVGEGADGSAETIGQWLIDRRAADAGSLPHEIEIELTTADPLPETLLRPRGQRVPTRGPLSLDLIQRVARELSERDDDALVVLGGHGDPLLHPQFDEALRILRSQGVYGIAVYTTGQRLTDDAIAAILAQRVDAVVFHVDAWSPETYARLNPGGDLETVKHSIERLIAARTAAQQAAPIVVPQMTKCLDNVGELDDFFDGWIRSAGCATVAGFSHFGGRLADRSVIDMSPPTRSACCRLMNRCVLLADGTVVTCDQDFAGQQPMGHLADQTLRQVWSGAVAQRFRDHHRAGGYDVVPLCPTCVEWHRP